MGCSSAVDAGMMHGCRIFAAMGLSSLAPNSTWRKAACILSAGLNTAAAVRRVRQSERFGINVIVSENAAATSRWRRTTKHRRLVEIAGAYAQCPHQQVGEQPDAFVDAENDGHFFGRAAIGGEASPADPPAAR
jgi:hypothetical protein